MTRILPFSLIISCWAMATTTPNSGGIAFNDTLNLSQKEISYTGTDTVRDLKIYWLPALGDINPGDCLTVDSNQTLIRCPICAFKINCTGSRFSTKCPIDTIRSPANHITLEEK